MFSIIRTAILVQILALPANAANLPPQGLVLCSQPQSTYVEVFRFSAVREEPVYTTFGLANGETRQPRNSAIIVRLNYPPPAGTLPTQEEAKRTVERSVEMAKKYPQYAAQFHDLQVRWEAVLQKLRKAEARAAVASEPARERLQLSAATYDDARLIATDGESAKIEHANGVASIPISSLTPSQIAQLNRTNSKVQIRRESTSPSAQAQNANPPRENTPLGIEFSQLAKVLVLLCYEIGCYICPVRAGFAATINPSIRGSCAPAGSAK